MPSVAMMQSQAVPSPSRRTNKRVKPPQKHDQTAAALSDIFDKLAKAIGEIQHKNASRLSFEEHYRYAYLLVLHKQPKMLYDGLIRLINQHLDDQARNRIEPAFPTSSLLLATAASSSASFNPSKPRHRKSSSNTINTSNNATQSNVTQKAEAEITADSSIQPFSENRLAQAMEGETFLNAVKGTWEDHKHCMGKLRDVLKYMDKVYTTAENLPQTYTLGLHLFLTTLLRNNSIPISANVLSVSLALICIERDGEIVNRGLLKTLTDMLCELREISVDNRQAEGESVYKSTWENEFLESTRAYYRAEANANLETLTTPEFLSRVERRLEEESDRVKTYLHSSTGILLFSLLDITLIQANAQMLLANPTSGISILLQEDRYDDLGRMYRLFGRVGDGHTQMTKAMKAWIVEQGNKIADTAVTGSTSAGAVNGNEAAEPSVLNKVDKGKGRARNVGDTDATIGGVDAEKSAKPLGAAAQANSAAVDWVTAVLALKDKLDTMWAEAFSKDRIFQNATNDAFVTFVNQIKKSPEYISIFMDELLKKGVKGKSEAEVDAALDKTIVLFRYLTDKDVFEDFYKRHLARRLHFGRSVSDDAERGLLQKLKLECGAAFVLKLEGMLKDISISDELNVSYRRFLEGLSSDRPDLDLAVQVCTASFWPTAPEISCILPPQFNRITKSFERYFDTRYTGRKLSWHPEHGTVDVKIRFNKGIKEINVATHGMVVLAQFENLDDCESLSYQDLRVATGLPESYLKRTLQSLSCAKYKILTKTPVSRNISSTDTFMFNAAFTAPVLRLKIATIANRVENAEEGRATDERVDRERAQVIDAALVRVMKNRKQLAHTELVAEVTHQLARRFTPKISMVKIAIERLIEKDYLERDDKDRKILRYLA